MVINSIQHVVNAVEACGAQLVLSADGRLQVRHWERVPAELQQQIKTQAIVIVSLLCRKPQYQLTTAQIEELRGWVTSGELDSIPVALISVPGVIGTPGDAGMHAAYWLRCYDVSKGHSRDEAHLRSLYYGALAYWSRQARLPSRSDFDGDDKHRGDHAGGDTQDRQCQDGAVRRRHDLVVNLRDEVGVAAPADDDREQTTDDEKEGEDQHQRQGQVGVALDELSCSQPERHERDAGTEVSQEGALAGHVGLSTGEARERLLVVGVIGHDYLPIV